MLDKFRAYLEKSLPVTDEQFASPFQRFKNQKLSKKVN